MYARYCIFLAESPSTQRSALLTRSSLSYRDRKKEKSMEFANGSFLRSDSRIFVQHPGAFPLFRTRFSRFLPSSSFPSPVFLASLLSAHFSFSKFHHTETPAYFILLTFYFALSWFFLWWFLPLSPPVLTLRIFLFAF